MGAVFFFGDGGFLSEKKCAMIKKAIADPDRRGSFADDGENLEMKSI